MMASIAVTLQGTDCAAISHISCLALVCGTVSVLLCMLAETSWLLSANDCMKMQQAVNDAVGASESAVPVTTSPTLSACTYHSYTLFEFLVRTFQPSHSCMHVSAVLHL